MGVKLGAILKPICKHGHDINVLGRSKDHACIACRRHFMPNNSWKRQGIVNSDGTDFTIVNYNRLFQIQGGRCAMQHCQKHQSKLKRALDVDHSHITNIVRGLLCSSCNQRLSTVEDTKFMEDAKLYLNREVH